MSNHFRHHTSFTTHFEPCQDGITPDQATLISKLMEQQNFLRVLVFCGDHKVIHYGLIDSDKTQIEYFFSPEDLIEYLKNQETLKTMDSHSIQL